MSLPVLLNLLVFCVFACLANNEQNEAHEEAVAMTCLLQLNHSMTSAGQHKQSGEVDIRERLQLCVNSYADALDDVVPDMGKAIRGHPLTVLSTSSRPVVFNAGSGTTGTESSAAALGMLGLTTAHAHYAAPMVDISEFLEWRQMVEGILYNETDSCIPALRKFDFASLPDSVDAVTDFPMPELFIDMFLSFPNAKFLLTLRPSDDWAESDLNQVPVQEPCGMYMQASKFGWKGTATNAMFFELNNEFIQCVVPEERLFKIDVFTQPTDGVMLELSRFLNLPPLDEEYPHCIGGHHQQELTYSEQQEQNPYCPVLNLFSS